MYRRRLIITLVLFAAGLLVILVRQGWMQLVKGDYYRREAEQSLRSVELLEAGRGRIVDRNGLILAVDEACHDFCLDYRLISANERWRKARVNEIAESEGAGDAEKTFDRRADFTLGLARSLAGEFGGNADERIERIKNKVRRIRTAVGRTVREERMSHAVVHGIDEQTAGMLKRPDEETGVSIMDQTIGAELRPSHRRRYPFGSVACHTIGFTGTVYREDAEKHNLRADEAPWLKRMTENYLPGDIIGRSGVERMAEKKLRPRRGYRRYTMPGEVDESVAPTEGREVRLTIDVELQGRLEQLFASTGRTGSVAVIDVRTCDVLALVSWPVYDLNGFWRDYEKLMDDRENLPLVHRAVYYTCAPGSTVKPVTALAGLGEGVINTSTEINCNGSNTRSRKGIPHCWIHRYNTGHGSLSVVPAIRHSCNIFFVETAHRMGGKPLSKWFGFFGFGRRPGTGLPSERPGSAEPGDRPYFPSDAWFMSIGQGVADASCLQVANAMATIARNGRFLSPRVCRDAGPRQEVRILQLSEAHLKAVRRGMYDVINDPDGTAYKPWHRELHLDIEVCGKTGTAQVPPMRVDSNDNGRIDTGDRIVKEGDHAWFAGFAPYRMPRIAFAVVVEYSGSGGTYAAPVAKETLRRCMKMGYLETD